MESLDLHSKWMIFVFIIGYIFITLEHLIRIDKATTALLTGIILWVIQYTSSDPVCTDLTCLGEHISNISQIVFFLLGALAIVELINVHKGFAIISDTLQTNSKIKMLWIISFLAFFLSAILDNLTTTIVMVTLLQKIVEKGRDRLVIGGAVVIAANAGGAWTPIGDVTTTMLWIGGQVSTLPIMHALFLPSLVCMVIAIFVLSFWLKGDFPGKLHKDEIEKLEPLGALVFFLGVGALVFVPVFKIVTGLPPFMGILFGLSVMWLVTDIVHSRYPDRYHLRMPSVLSNIHFSGLLFFLGILLAIDALDAALILEHLAFWFNQNIGNTTIIATFIGLASAIVDNVPLVAASMGMYSLEKFPQDHPFWQLIAYCAGTGGSILVIGSAAGIVYMGLEKVDFFWYMKYVSLAALVGYFAGIGVYLLF